MRSNLAILGNEIIQFRDAEFIDDGRYKLTGLLRGRLGTENETAGHVEGERFVLLDSLIFKATMPKALINNSIDIKVVSFGQNINDVTAISITYMAKNLIPYAVGDLDAVKDDSGDITISWLRRSRESSTWRDYVDMPLSESVEAYKIEIIDDENQIVRTISAGTTSVIYTISEQTTDFGGSQDSIKARVYQISELVGKGLETEKTFIF